MTMTNVDICDFVIYCSFEEKILTICVSIDKEFCIHLLSSLKIIYYEKMIHKVCIFKKLV